MNQRFNSISSSNKNLLFLSAFTAVVLAITGCGSTVSTTMEPLTPSPVTQNDGTSASLETTNPAADQTQVPVQPASDSTQAPTPTPVKTPVAEPVKTPAIKTSVYKDGAYSAVGSYTSPAGPEEIVVSLTLKNDIVTDATVVPKATAMASVRMQNAFASGYKQYVVGKSLDSINVGKVSGSSLTPLGFNDAVAKIKAQAK